MPQALRLRKNNHKRKAFCGPKVKDRRPDGDRLRDREQRIERARLLEMQAGAGDATP